MKVGLGLFTLSFAFCIGAFVAAPYVWPLAAGLLAVDASLKVLAGYKIIYSKRAYA